MALKPDVDKAIAEIRETFAGKQVDVTEDGQGGARVRVHDMHIGDQYKPSTSWVEFAITFQYPAADVYPHFFVGGVTRVDGGELGGEFQQVDWNGAPATQLSRRSNRMNQDVDTAAIKLTKVLAWVRSR